MLPTILFQRGKMIITNMKELRAECKDVSLFEAQDIIIKLEDELSKSKTGVGLAAPQIGIQKRVCIIRCRNFKIDLVNPIIIKKYDLFEFYNEGCLSFKNDLINTKRFNEIVMQDSFHPAGIIFTGVESVIVQHEIGHLYGEIMYDLQIKIPARNEKCWCNNGKKYKLCHLGKIIKS